MLSYLIELLSEVWDEYRSYSFAADIWSLGCVMAFLCNRSKHLFLKMREIHNWNGLPAGRIRGGYSDELINLIKRMLDPDPKSRPSAKEVISK